MATMQLFNGETTYGTKERKKVLTSILRVRNIQQGTERLVEMRGHGKLYPYSDLETLCEKLLCEFSFVGCSNSFASAFSKLSTHNPLEIAKPQSPTAVASVAVQNLFALGPASAGTTSA
jgi:hypothetical protein